jgi:tRNA(adenine34) deaminase
MALRRADVAAVPEGRSWPRNGCLRGLPFGVTDYGTMYDSRMRTHDAYMLRALDEARTAASIGEVPIGAVVVLDGEVIATGSNRREIDADPTAHAEMIAVRAAARALGRWRLEGCTVYVTLEPCPMCAGALHAARVDRCVYGATDPKAGALGTLYDIASDQRLNHRYEVVSGVLAEESTELLRDFFARLRARGCEPDPLEG